MTRSTETEIIDPFEAAMELGDIRGRSPWEDAWHRLLKNRAAVVSALIMGGMILLVIIGPAVISWEADFTDWDNTSSAPSLATGHWFGTDAVGRDILVRTLEGGRISLLVGVVATLADEHILVSPALRLFLVTGLLGGFTTFSAFGMETWQLLENGHALTALGNAMANVVAGLVAVIAGVTITRAML